MNKTTKLVLASIAVLISTHSAARHMGLLDAFKIKPVHEKYADRNPVLIDKDEDMQSFVRNMGNTPDCVFYTVANTGSMEPFIMGGDRALGKKVAYEDLQVGDVVNYRPKWNKGNLTIHRLVLKDKDGFIASGDNNKNSESGERVTKDNYDSKCIMIYRAKKKADKGE